MELLAGMGGRAGQRQWQTPEAQHTDRADQADESRLINPGRPDEGRMRGGAGRRPPREQRTAGQGRAGQAAKSLFGGEALGLGGKGARGRGRVEGGGRGVPRRMLLRGDGRNSLLLLLLSLPPSLRVSSVLADDERETVSNCVRVRVGGRSRPTESSRNEISALSRARRLAPPSLRVCCLFRSRAPASSSRNHDAPAVPDQACQRITLKTESAKHALSSASLAALLLQNSSPGFRELILRRSQCVCPLRFASACRGL